MNDNSMDRPNINYPKFARQFSVLDFSKDREIPAISLFDMPEIIPKESAIITSTDLEGRTKEINWSGLKNLPVEKVESPLICQIFNWSELVDCEGWKLKYVLDSLGIDGDENKHYSFYSRDGEYFETLTHDEARDDRTLLTYRMNGEYLSLEHGAPLRLIVPFLQGYKSVKWVDRIGCFVKDPIGIKRILKQSKTAKLSERFKDKYNI